MPYIYSSGDPYKKTIHQLQRLSERVGRPSYLDKYGRHGVDALRSATPVDTGATREGWYYVIKNDRSGSSIEWHNRNVVNGTPVAILIQYGHGTGTGGYVEGLDYINPAIKPIFEKIQNDILKEVRGGN